MLYEHCIYYFIGAEKGLGWFMKLSNYMYVQLWCFIPKLTLADVNPQPLYSFGELFESFQ